MHLNLRAALVSVRRYCIEVPATGVERKAGRIGSFHSS
jgi:hypothetical protein